MSIFKRLWTKICKIWFGLTILGLNCFPEPLKPEAFKPFVANIKGHSIKILEAADIEEFSRQTEYDRREGNYQFYTVRNPKNGVVMVICDSLESLKTKYPGYEVVPPICR